MLKTEGQIWISRWRKRWILFYTLCRIAFVFALSLVLSALSTAIFHLPEWGAAIIATGLISAALLIRPVWKITELDVCRYLNNTYPQLEDSADLLIQNPEDLTLLKQLQQTKLQSLIQDIEKPQTPVNKFYWALVVLVVAALMSFTITRVTLIGNDFQVPLTTTQKSPDKLNENIPVEIADFSITITPPQYTGKDKRTQKQFAVKAETGALIKWKIKTSVVIKDLKILFNNKEAQRLKQNNQEATNWDFTKTIEKSGFYQLELNGTKSDLYQIEVIPDLPVSIKITHPKQHTIIDIGEPQKINLRVNLTDDYGIQHASISATLASGKGEGVSFTEKNIPFDATIGNQKSLTLTKHIDLKNLGMKPGDELYFFVKAVDNHNQSSRSDVYFVSIVDTTELMSMAGMTNGVNLVPEYFRSERQIIIDTEKLLKEQRTISSATFKTRSNDLGIDQKLLRLRYGQFLGEENETEIGGEHEDHDAHEEHKNEGEKFGDVTSIMDKYAHKHDIAEDATFFEPEMKAQLKAVLTEMWNAELRLRTYKPQEALLYEYKALRLLKDLQQKSRAYVAKTTVKVAALKPEKRLSGELDKIIQPVQKMSIQQKETRLMHLKTSLALLDIRKSGKKFAEGDLVLLNETEKYMIGAAADHPATYLQALSNLRKLSFAATINKNDIELVQRAISKMMQNEVAEPQKPDSSPASALYQNYFNNLSKTGQ